MNRKTAAFLQQYLCQFMMILAAVSGLIFIFLIPPWQNADEPGHFEYAWLAANEPGWPQQGDYNQSMRRELASSMIENQFQDYPVTQLLQVHHPISIITPQTGDVPLYYFLASLTLRLAKFNDITFQLYLTRFVSFSLFLATIWLAIKSSQLLFGNGHPLTWMVPLFMICLGTFVENMTSVNNDVAAIFSLSLFIWLSIRILTKGWTLIHGLSLLAAFVLCLLSKSTAYIVLPLTPIVILLSISQRKHLKIIWLSITIGLLLVGGLMFSWRTDAPAFFYGNHDMNLPERIYNPKGPVGQYVMVQNRSDRQFFYGLTDTAKQAIQGKTVSFGAYVWADKPTTIKYPMLAAPFEEEMIRFSEKKISINQEPQFFIFSTKIPEEPVAARYLRFSATQANSNTIYWDGMMMVLGEVPDNTVPEYLDTDGNFIQWNGKEYQNLIRNGSGEKPWPVFSKALHNLLPNSIQFSASQLLSVIDWQTNGWYFNVIISRTFRTFWGKFGWTNIPLVGKKPFRIILFWIGLTIINMVIGLFQNESKIQKKILMFLVSTLIAQFFLVTFRGMGRWFSPNPYIPVGRYLFPVMIPISLAVAWAWFEGSAFIRKRIEKPFPFIILIFGLCCVGLLIWSILSLKIYFS